MTEKKLAANRMNALKSTGPKSPIGKGVSSRNSVKHGLLAEAPILSGLESRKAWERHRNGVLESMAPVGYLEELLTIRLAVVSWKMWRVSRFETEVAGAAVATAEIDLVGRAEDGLGKPPDPTDARAKANIASMIVEILENLATMIDGEKLDKHLAAATLWAFWRELPGNFEGGISIPGIPDEDTEFNAFDGWTAGLLRKAAEVYAAAARMTPDALLNKCILSISKNREDAEEKERDLVARGQRWKLLLERENRSRKLLEPDVLDKVSRYDSHLERSFFPDPPRNSKTPSMPARFGCRSPRSYRRGYDRPAGGFQLSGFAGGTCDLGNVVSEC
jgi:hypothetical protein